MHVHIIFMIHSFPNKNVYIHTYTYICTRIFMYHICKTCQYIHYNMKITSWPSPTNPHQDYPPQKQMFNKALLREKCWLITNNPLISPWWGFVGEGHDNMHGKDGPGTSSSSSTMGFTTVPLRKSWPYLAGPIDQDGGWGPPPRERDTSALLKIEWKICFWVTLW